MEIIEFIIIGILQGIFEWLPISSQGISVVVLTNFFKVSAQSALDRSIFLHLGTLLAAFVYFFEDIKELFFKTKINDLFNFRKNIKFDYATSSSRFILISVFFTVLLGVPIYFLIRDSVTAIQVSTLTIAIGVLLLLTGVMQIKIKQAEKLIPNLKASNAFFVGLAQSFSAIPGVSRSGITTSTMLFQGFNPSNAFKYSFLISIPTILIAEIGILMITGFTFNPLILISVLFAFIFGYITIGILMKIVKKLDFSYVCFILGIAYILIGII
jgi:undecaprenyl-diphosphatase